MIGEQMRMRLVSQECFSLEYKQPTGGTNKLMQPDKQSLQSWTVLTKAHLEYIRKHFHIFVCI